MVCTLSQVLLCRIFLVITTFHVVERVKTRWTSLRTSFGRKRKGVANLPSGSGATTQTRWPYYRQMLFIAPYIKHREWVIFDSALLI